MVNLNFGGLMNEFSDYGKSKYAILPVPYEKTTTYLQGTVNGPEAIIEASCEMELYDPELDVNPSESGITTLPSLELNCSPEEMVSQVKSKVSPILNDGKFPIILGGEHSVTVGVFDAVHEKYPKASVLQLDAHADLRDEYLGSKLNHACVMSRIREKAPAVQVGIRSMCEEEAEKIKENNYPVYSSKQVIENNPVNEIIGKLGDEVYVTVDLDVFDPSMMPAVGTPEPGGLDWFQVTSLLSKVFKEKTIVGFDLVELSPKPNLEYADFTASKLLYKMLAFLK